MEQIDAHHHLWRYKLEDYSWIGEDMHRIRRNFLICDLEREMIAASIGGTVAVQARQTLEETEWLLKVADQSSSVLGVVGWLPLSSTDLKHLLRQFGSRKKLKALRHVVQDEPDEQFILRADFNRGVATLLDTGLVYDILVFDRHLPQANQFVKNHPQQMFVLDHLAKPRVATREVQPWRDDLHRLAENPNVHRKLSGLVTEADWINWSPDDLNPYLDAALSAFGPERLLAGSETGQYAFWPPNMCAGGRFCELGVHNSRESSENRFWVGTPCACIGWAPPRRGGADQTTEPQPGVSNG